MPGHHEARLTVEDFRELAAIDPSRFQAASNFSVELAPRAGGAGTVLRFVDSSLDVAIEFSWWDDPEDDLSRWELEDIPIGTPEEPYFDAEQGWRILIWQLGDTVYVASGGSDEEDTYDTFLSAAHEKYRSAWSDVIESSKSR